MRDRFSLRNIPKEAEHLAEVIHRQTNLSESDVCRLALVSGMLVEVVRLLPEKEGTIGDLEIAYLAKALRRVLGPLLICSGNWESIPTRHSSMARMEEEHHYQGLKEHHPK